MLCRALALPMLAVALTAASVPPVSPPILLTAGQARQVRDEAAAQRFYMRSCEIAERNGEPNFEACRFARNNLEAMKAR